MLGSSSTTSRRASVAGLTAVTKAVCRRTLCVGCEPPAGALRAGLPRTTAKHIGMLRRRLPLAVLAVSVVAVGTAIAGPSIPSTPATAKAYPSESHATTYPTYDAAGRVNGKAKWHWTPTGGNCCETYVSTAGKRLLEYGGSLP